MQQGQELTVADGAYLEITGNQVTNDLLDGYGGGIYVGYGANFDPIVVLPADAQIYNDHATKGGDDIYVSQGVKGPSLTFGKVGTDWVLDDCEHLIDGWYQEQLIIAGKHMQKTPKQNHIELGEDFDEETGWKKPVTGDLSLKAAHGTDPKDKVSYPGLDKKVGDDDEKMNDEDVDAAAGQKVNFQLTSNVPTNLTKLFESRSCIPARYW